MNVLFKMVEYVGWAATTLIGVGGSWLWDFTEPDPSRPGHRLLTQPGRRALIALIVSLVCAVGSMVYNDVSAAARQKEERREKDALQAQLDRLQSPFDLQEIRVTAVIPAESPLVVALYPELRGKLTKSANVPPNLQRPLRALIRNVKPEGFEVYRKGDDIRTCSGCIRYVIDFQEPSEWSVMTYHPDTRAFVVVEETFRSSEIDLIANRAELVSFADLAGRPVRIETTTAFVDSHGEYNDFRLVGEHRREFPIKPIPLRPNAEGYVDLTLPDGPPWRTGSAT